jgi:hypothetical protein
MVSKVSKAEEEEIWLFLSDELQSGEAVVRCVVFLS